MRKRLRCIRGIEKYCKEDCPAYITRKFRDPKDSQVLVTKSKCIDLWADELAFNTLWNIETLNAEIVKLRNGLLETIDNKDVPKATRTMLTLPEHLETAIKGLNQKIAGRLT